MNCLFRIDVGARIGTGHAMRCLALAQAWQDAGGRARFVMATSSPALDRRLESERIDVARLHVAEPGNAEDAVQTVELAQRAEAAWVVVDGCHFRSDYQRILKQSALPLLVVDDNGYLDHYSADLVLNQNLHARESLYPSREPSTQLLLGTRYVLLRREFGRWLAWTRTIPQLATRVLVTLGGADPDNRTLKVIQALAPVRSADLDVVVIVGGSNPHRATLEEATRTGHGSVRLLHQVTDMAALMAERDIAISAAGSTTWEIAFMGLPALLSAIVAGEEPSLSHVVKTGLCLGLGDLASIAPATLAERFLALAHDPAERARMSQVGRQLVPGRGAQLVVQRMLGWPAADVPSAFADEQPSAV